MPYYPGQSFIIGMTTIRRERRLPRGTIGEVMVQDHQDVEADTIVLRGALPGDFIILDLLAPLGLKQVEQFTDDMLKVAVGQFVEKGGIIASSGQGRNAKTLKAPARVLVARVEGGQIIMQLNPQPIEMYAMAPGRITSVRGNNEVLLETTGALIQCAWGNDKSGYSAYKMEPDGGIESMQDDTIMSQYRNSAMVLTKPILNQRLFGMAIGQEIKAIIAPSMHADLREIALRQTIPVILTEGFGEQQMSEVVYNLLRDNVGRPALIEATEPQRWSSARPEIIIPLPSGGILPTPPEGDQALVEGALVRLTRAPYMGLTGKVRRISEMPRSVENGLRLPGADVQLADGKMVFVPLANLEMLGRLAD
ncbi:MAG: hypothetical protein ABI947_17875 [Chloroflexota bacterium]